MRTVLMAIWNFIRDFFYDPYAWGEKVIAAAVILLLIASLVKYILETGV